MILSASIDVASTLQFFVQTNAQDQRLVLLPSKPPESPALYMPEMYLAKNIPSSSVTCKFEPPDIAPSAVCL
jgi:hypothetical protein